jgi:hypothetical protein
MEQLCILIELSIEDLITKKGSDFLLILPLLFLSAIQLWNLALNRSAFTAFGEAAIIFKESAIWLLSLVAIVIDGAKEYIDISQGVVIMITIILLSVAIVLIKDTRLNHKLKNCGGEHINENEAEASIHTLILNALTNSPYADLQLDVLL